MGRVEQGILQTLSQNGGEAFQSEIVKITGFSRSRVSEILSVLEDRGLVSKLPLGKNYKVILRTSIEKRKSSKAEKEIRLGFTRSAEYGFLPEFARSVRHDTGRSVDFRIYENGVDVVRDLSLLRLDLAIAPVFTLFTSFSLGSPFRIVAPAGSGGSSLIANMDARSGRKESARVATTKLSTMELLLRSSINSEILPSETGIRYSSSPSVIMQELVSRTVDAACLWEPYATLLLREEKGKLDRVIRYDDIGENVCCALAAGNQIEDRLLTRLCRAFTRSVEAYEKNPESFLSGYSVLTGFDHTILRTVTPEYHHPLRLETRLVTKQLERAGVVVPLPSSFGEAIREP